MNQQIPSVMPVTLPEFRNRLESVVGAKMVSIVALTDVKLTGGKGNSLQGRVTKRSYVSGVINWSYENSVNRQRVRESEGEAVDYFIPEPRAWGQRLHDTVKNRMLPTVEHKGEFYLELKVERSIRHQYYLDGKPVDASVIEPHLPKKSESSRQELDKPVILRDYKLRSIENLTVDGTVFQVKAA